MNLPDPASALVAAVAAARLPSPSRCREIRENAGVTRDEVAEILQVNRNSVRNWETGRAKPTRDRAIAYAELLERLRLAVER